MATHINAQTEARVLTLVRQLSTTHPTHWVAVQEVAERMHLERDVVDAVVRRAVGQGRVLAEGEPPHRVTFRTADLTDFSKPN